MACAAASSIQNEAPQIWSKAAAMSARTLEMLDDMGLVARMHERGRPVYGLNLHKGRECAGGASRTPSAASSNDQ